MLTKMICKNIDKRNMLLYSSGIILSVALEMFFGAAFIADGQYGLSEKAGNMDWLCTMFFLMAGIMSVFFVLYSTGYYVKTKNKDYSLLLMFGSSRKLIFRFFTVEFLLIYLFSMSLGTLTGGVFSALLLLLFRLLSYPVTFSLSDIFQVIATVVKMNFVLFVLEYLFIFVYFCKKDLSDMQRRGIKREKKHDRTCFLAIGGGFLVTIAMRLLNDDNLLYHFISMMICLAGVYILMSFGGSLLLMLLKRFRKFYYGHMITLNEFYYKFKSNCRLLFIMLVLNFGILFFTGGAVISQAPEDADSPAYPFGFVGVVQDGEQKDAVREILGHNVIEITAVRGYLNKEDIGWEEKAFLCISDREYSQLTTHHIHLQAGDAILVNETTASDVENPYLLYLSQDEPLAITEVHNDIVFGTEQPDCLREFIVLPEAAAAAYPDNTCSILVKKGNLQKEYEQYRNQFSEEESNLFWRCEFFRETSENMVFVKIVSLFAGIFCLLSCFGIFALKMQGDLPFIDQKYRLLYHIGMSERSIYKAMCSEYRNLLAIPVAVSLVLSSIYVLAETTDKDMFLSYYVCRYIPFLILFVCLHAVFFYWIKKMILQRNTASIVNENQEGPK